MDVKISKFIRGIHCLLLFCMIGSNASTINDSSATSDRMQSPPRFKNRTKRCVVYFPESRGLETWIDKIPYEKVTHIAYAFINPDSDGLFITDNDYWQKKLISKAHENGVRVLASLGGGNPDAYSGSYKKLLMPDQLPAFTDHLIQFIQQQDFDGVDVDLESQSIDENYVHFVAALSKLLKVENKEMSAALAFWNGSRIPDDAMKLFDFINVMAYDETGPWNDKKGNHAPYAFAKTSLKYWNQRGVPKEKLVLGIPFYGYEDSTNDYAVCHKMYKEIMEMNPEAWKTDRIDRLFYNGEKTVIKKVKLANNYGGIMVWEITQDAEGEHALIDVIDEYIQK